MKESSQLEIGKRYPVSQIEKEIKEFDIMGISGRKWASQPTNSYVKFRKWLDKKLKRDS